MSATGVRYRCTCCGELHEGFGDLAFAEPLYYHELTPAERQAARLTSDTCEVGEHRFVRGILQIPVEGDPEGFAYGVWVSLSQKNYERYLELFDARDGLPTEPWFGWLSNRLPGYDDTLSLKTNVYLRPYPARPAIELGPTDHALVREQRDGITRQRLHEIWEANQHPGHTA
jgi:hypothetical protein